MKKKISVIITSYNRGALLKRAVESVLAQTYTNFEVIVVDDCSSDTETQKVLLELAAISQKIKILRNATNKGANYSRNFGITNSSGYYYTGLDDDDYFEPKRLEILEHNYSNDLAFVCDNYILYDGIVKKTRFGSKKFLKTKDLLYANLAGNQVFTTIEKIKSAGMFDEKLKRLQDQDMWLRLLVMFGKAKRLNFNTYIMDVSHEGERITSNVKSASAYEDFFNKHKDKMNKFISIKNINRINYYEGNCLSLTCLVFTPKFFFKSILNN